MGGVLSACHSGGFHLFSVTEPFQDIYLDGLRVVCEEKWCGIKSKMLGGLLNRRLKPRRAAFFLTESKHLCQMRFIS